ncbi:MAG: hypothetical protein NZ700_08460, partial [Gemmataceae bacterium]|nr:hypothetical protein [Gemmataceae bacterium]
MKGRWLEVLWLLAWGAASSIWCVTAAERLGATFDEPLYLRRGLERWRSGSYAGLMKLGTMPLPIDVETLPLYLWERIRGEAFDPIVDLPRLLPIARAANLVFWWLLLVYAWRLGAALGGRWAGLGAVALLACEPTVLAHASLATTDLSITACTLALVYHARQGLAGGWRRRVGWPAFWWAACLLAKASALVFGPLCLLVVELEQRGRRWVGAPLVGQPRSLKELAQVGAIGLVLVFAYCGTDWQPEPSFVDWARGLPESRAGRTLRWGAENLRIFSNAGEGLIRQVRHNIRGHSYGTYLLGEAHPRSVWYYFPVALSMKLSPVLLLLPGVFLLLRPGALLNTAFMGACVLLAYSLNCRVQIGVRLMLPLVALAAVGLAAAAVA